MHPPLKPARDELHADLVSAPDTFRPLVKSRETVDEIFALMAEGKSLMQACHRLGYKYAGVWQWVTHDDSLKDAYRDARYAAASYYGGQVVEIADDSGSDWVETDKGPQLNREHVQRSKLRIEARQWYAKVLAPREFGDKLALGGSDDMPPLKTINAAMTPAEAYELMLNGQARLPKPEPEADIEDLT